jgi:hypothetical protein
MTWEHRDDSFGMQHDCAPLPNGNITLFANGINTTGNPFSRVIELDPRTHKTVWEYRAKPTYTFFSPHISGAQRLASGTTLCEGQWGGCSSRPGEWSGNMSARSWGGPQRATRRTGCF